jgi:hypothetical protein
MMVEQLANHDVERRSVELREVWSFRMDRSPLSFIETERPRVPGYFE